MIKRFKSVVYVGLVLGLMLLTTVGVLADTGSIVLTGAADIVWTNDAAFAFEAKTLDGNKLSATDDASGDGCVWGLVDGRGSGDGWKISVSSSDLTGLLANDGATPVTLSLTSSATPAYNEFGLDVQIQEADVTVKNGAEGSMPVSGLTYDVNAASFLTAVKTVCSTAVRKDRKSVV